MEYSLKMDSEASLLQAAIEIPAPLTTGCSSIVPQLSSVLTQSNAVLASRTVTNHGNTIGDKGMKTFGIVLDVTYH